MAKLAYATTIILALAACGDSGIRDDHASVPPAEEMNEIKITNALDTSQAEDSVSAATLSFPVDSAIYNAFEVAISKVAINQGYSMLVRAFANKVMEAHKDANEMLRKVEASEKTIKLPRMLPRQDHIRLPRDEQLKVNALAKLAGTEFDQAYADGQIAALGEMLLRLKEYAESGNISRMRSYASGMVPITEKLLQEARQLPR